MSDYTLEKEFRDFADDIEAVSIHFLCSPIGAEPDWNAGRMTRFMPLVGPGMRSLKLKLPAEVLDTASGKPVQRYMLFHYFEIFRGGNRYYSQTYSELVETGVQATAAQAVAGEARPDPTKGGEVR